MGRGEQGVNPHLKAEGGVPKAVSHPANGKNDQTDERRPIRRGEPLEQRSRPTPPVADKPDPSHQCGESSVEDAMPGGEEVLGIGVDYVGVGVPVDEQATDEPCRQQQRDQVLGR